MIFGMRNALDVPHQSEFVVDEFGIHNLPQETSSLNFALQFDVLLLSAEILAEGL